MTLWKDKTFATIGPRLAPISNVKEYREIAAARFLAAASPINVIREGMKTAIADTYKVDSKVIITRLFVSNINKSEMIIIDKQIRSIFLALCFFSQFPHNKDRGVPTKPIHLL